MAIICVTKNKSAGESMDAAIAEAIAVAVAAQHDVEYRNINGYGDIEAGIVIKPSDTLKAVYERCAQTRPPNWDKEYPNDWPHRTGPKV